MILSKKNNFLFLHNRKAAGTSVQYILSKYCTNDDIVTPSDEYLKNRNFQKAVNYLDEQIPYLVDTNVKNILERSKNNLRQSIKLIPFIRDSSLVNNKNIYFQKLFHIPNYKYTTHSSFSDLLKYNSITDLQGLFKFAIYRNPWDQLISLYLNRGKMLNTEDGVYPIQYHKKKVSFEIFVKYQAKGFVQGKNIRDIFFHDKIKLDKVFHFNNLSEDFKNYFPFNFANEISNYLKNSYHNSNSKGNPEIKKNLMKKELFEFIKQIAGDYTKFSMIKSYDHYLDL